MDRWTVQDVCVRATVLDACQLSFETHLIAAATRPVDQSWSQSLEEMRGRRAVIEQKGP
jgi:nicotinamidase/pyrazinamidase